MMRLFRKRVDQDEKLLKNIKEYEQKEKIKQQKPKVLGQKPVKRKINQEKSTSM
tara:strand:+ start:183 stop:344 length:162 start_codon:yes stop_codon:yes gene_type:complete